MIPKIIHYVWVGDQPKPDSVIKCIQNWRQYLPDYKIIEWGNDDLRKINNTYVNEAFHAKKWAFVSDYLRLYALYHHGGLYLDTDIIITHAITPFLIDNDFFMGLEPYKKTQAYPMTAVIGASIHHKIILGLLNSYSNSKFFKANGELDLTPNPMRFADFFSKEFHLKFPCHKDQLIELDKNCRIYPTHYFCQPEKDRGNYAIHLFNGSWLDGYSRKTILSFLHFELIRFKRINHHNNIIPLKHNEQIIFKIKISKNRFYALVQLISQ